MGATDRVRGSMSPSPRTGVPKPEHVARRIAERRHPQVALGGRLLDDRSSALSNSRDGLVDSVDIDEGQQTGFGGRLLLQLPRAADVPGGVIEARAVASPRMDRPPEHSFIELRRRLRIGGWDLEIRKSSCLGSVAPRRCLLGAQTTFWLTQSLHRSPSRWRTHPVFGEASRRRRGNPMARLIMQAARAAGVSRSFASLGDRSREVHGTRSAPSC